MPKSQQSHNYPGKISWTSPGEVMLAVSDNFGVAVTATGRALADIVIQKSFVLLQVRIYSHLHILFSMIKPPVSVFHYPGTEPR